LLLICVSNLLIECVKRKEMIDTIRKGSARFSCPTAERANDTSDGRQYRNGNGESQHPVIEHDRETLKLSKAINRATPRASAAAPTYFRDLVDVLYPTQTNAPAQKTTRW